MWTKSHTRGHNRLGQHIQGLLDWLDPALLSSSERCQSEGLTNSQSMKIRPERQVEDSGAAPTATA